MKLGFNLNLPFFELYEIDQKTVSDSYLEKDGIELHPLVEVSNLKKVSHPLSTKFNLDHEIIFYGGSFNPWHEGHQACLNLLPSDKQVVVLLDKNPQKESPVFNPSQRWQELEKKIYLSDGEIYPGFLLKEQSNPTIEWMNTLHLKYPKIKSSLLIGFDQLKNFHTWKEVATLSQKIENLYVVSRLENEQEYKVITEELKTKFKLSIIPLGHHPYENLSSTAIRGN